MPDFPITARADPTPASRWVTIVGATYTSVVLLGDVPTPTPAPVASSSPSKGTVIGAATGSIVGFLLLLMLLWYCIRRSRTEWISHSRRNSVEEVFIANPNVAPVRLHVVDEHTEFTATKVVIDRTQKFDRFKLSRPSKKRERPAEASRTWEDVVSSTSFFSLITRTISPSLSDTKFTFNEEAVQQSIKHSQFRANLFIVTGFKISRGAEVAVESVKERGGNLNLGIDITPFALPIKVGPVVGAKRDVGEKVEEKHGSNFVYSHQLGEIRYKRKTLEEQKGYLKGNLTAVGRERKEEALDGLEEEAEWVGLSGVM
ncbi:hypothetical protein B2J93_4710 [Marssonina coronariae]|uniref:Uncharacterized protein n=1 Tax=Diplocarpon coronariae TaxID=2795749 RepID=A0A218Z2J6_9HELO|nr:hypothetical protein B2J93_4710 [Marssonina coronariae]